MASPAKEAQSRFVVSGTPSLVKSVEPFAVSFVSYAGHHQPVFPWCPGAPAYA
jgi:hypothetical protein